MPSPTPPPHPRLTIGIVGLGLIGGSLGLDLRRCGHTLIGVSRNPQTCTQAIALGAVDHANCNLASLAPADVVILCTPIDALVSTAAALVPHLQPSTILTDVGSVKASIVPALEALWPNVLGAHPMAGTAEQGILAAQAQLFVDRPYVLTPTPQTRPDAIATLQHLIQDLRARPYQCSPSDHDRAVAWISHLPVLISASLIQACLKEPASPIRQLAQHLASSGFRDTSRVGGGNPDLGLLMARYNRDALLSHLEIYQQTLTQLQQAIAQEDWPSLQAQLESAHQHRPAFVEPPV